MFGSSVSLPVPSALRGMRQTLARLALAATFSLMATAPSHAIDARAPLPIRAATDAPAGAASLCGRYDWACAGSKTQRAMPQNAMDVIRAINLRANRVIHPLSDAVQYAREENWSLPTRKGGDCEDYVLYKKHELIKAGIPAERLLIATVLDRRNRAHAVLVVRTGKTDLVLDNMTNRILNWQRTGYTFLRMQDPANPNRWVALLAGGVLAQT